jgi:1,2-dihydroxy-3-keto-5-methylthiopentene dioxygenase
MRAYWYDNEPGDPRLPHDSHRPIPPSHLAHLGIHTSHHPTLPTVNALASSRGYTHRDEITISPTAMGSSDVYAAKLAVFFTEHLHEDEEIRYIVDGGGYFDVRAEGDEWVRLELGKGDLVVLPAGIYHRFTPDERDYTKAMRLFKDEPKWTPLNRGPETDENPYRKEYVKSLEKGEGAAAPAAEAVEVQ